MDNEQAITQTAIRWICSCGTLVLIAAFAACAHSCEAKSQKAVDMAERGYYSPAIHTWLPTSNARSEAD